MSHITGVATNLFCAHFYRHSGKRHSGKHHCVLWQTFCVGVVVVGPLPLLLFALLFSGWRCANLAGGLACRCFLVFFGFCSDLPHCMWPIVSMWNFLFYRFFSCKDRALERDRPYQREKKNSMVESGHVMSILSLSVRKRASGPLACVNLDLLFLGSSAPAGRCSTLEFGDWEPPSL